MFKWDRLLRKKKMNKVLNYKEVDFHSESLKHQDEDKAENEGEYEIVEIEILPAKIICPDCGGITLEGLEFCDKCGGEL